MNDAIFCKLNMRRTRTCKRSIMPAACTHSQLLLRTYRSENQGHAKYFSGAHFQAPNLALALKLVTAQDHVSHHCKLATASCIPVSGLSPASRNPQLIFLDSSNEHANTLTTPIILLAFVSSLCLSNSVCPLLGSPVASGGLVNS